MSEAEIFLIRQRMLGAKRAKAERGELILPLPVGYVRRPSGEAAFDPDEQAQHVVRLIFRTFQRLGTLNAVLRYLVGHADPAAGPGALGPAKGELEWRRPTRETLQIMLHNPVYAGYYAYGRRQVEPRRKVPGRPGHREGGERPPASGWSCCRAGFRPTSPRTIRGEPRPDGRQPADRGVTRARRGTGQALLSGLLRCGLCGGHRMTVSYHDPSARAAYGYTCGFYQVNYGTGGRCQHIAGPALDDYVTGQVLDAVAPAALEVSMAAAAHAENERAALDKLWRQRVERARYAADRARRQYQLAEPENRLVARQLEADWEAALAEAGRLEADYQRFAEQTPAVLAPAERDAIRSLAADLPRVWNAPTTTRADRKELLRILIDDITVAVDGDSELVDVTITWAGGHQTAGQAVRPVARLDQLSYYPALLDTVTGSPAKDATAGRSPARSTPRDTGRPSAPRSSPASRSATSSASTPSARMPRAGPPSSRTWTQASGPSRDCPPSSACPPPASTTGSTAAGSPPATHPGAGTGSSPPTRSRCASYASAGTARPATTPAPAGHHPRQKPAKRRKKDKEGSRERQIPLDR